jgi:hypothetical protein
MEVPVMSIQTEPAIDSFILADQEGNYYVVPVETFARGRVPAERKADIEAALREHDVTGYHPGVAFAAGVAVGGVAAAGAVVAGVGVLAGLVVVGAALSSDCFPVKPPPGGNMQ